MSNPRIRLPRVSEDVGPIPKVVSEPPMTFAMSMVMAVAALLLIQGFAIVRAMLNNGQVRSRRGASRPLEAYLSDPMTWYITIGMAVAVGVLMWISGRLRNAGMRQEERCE